MKIQESGEMYLESILVLRDKLPNVRAIDIVNYTGYTKPSISRALGLLKQDGFIIVDQSGHITLTDDGEARAIKVYERHKVLTEFFQKIGVDAATASADACKIEHVISDETFNKIKEQISGIMSNYIREHLLKLQNINHAEFCSKLMPTVDRQTILGIKTPILRRMATEITGTNEAKEFILDVPHKYFEENTLHAFLIEKISDPTECLNATEAFLPYIDNWSTCDSLRPKALKKDLDLLKIKAIEWINSEKTYTVRFGIEMFMVYFLDNNFSVEQNKLIAEIRSDEYYVKMMVAWYFATALAKQYEDTIPFLENNSLDIWTHNKTIQKAIESYRITNKQKDYLRILKRKEDLA